jgi:hypothetical protein
MQPQSFSNCIKKQNKCRKASTFIVCCNAKVRKDKGIRHWSASQVVAWFELLGFMNIRDKIIKTDITGDKLISMVESGLPAHEGLNHLLPEKTEIVESIYFQLENISMVQHLDFKINSRYL